MPKTLLEEYLDDTVHMRLFQQERAIYEVTELLESAMRECGVSRSALAKRLGKSKGWVTQLLDGQGNKTVRTVADALAVLGREFRSFIAPIQISNASTEAEVKGSRTGSSRPYDVSAKEYTIKMHDTSLRSTNHVANLPQKHLAPAAMSQLVAMES